MSNTEDHKAENVYELGYLLLPSIPEDKLSPVVDSIKKVISDAGAKELDSEDPFMHDLAYKMSKTVGASKYVVNEAYIGWVKFEAEPSQIAEIKTGVEKMNEMLRHLMIKAPRETEFTFAKAEAARAEKENQRNMPEEVAVEKAPEEAAPTIAEGNDGAPTDSVGADAAVVE